MSLFLAFPSNSLATPLSDSDNLKGDSSLDVSVRSLHGLCITGEGARDLESAMKEDPSARERHCYSERRWQLSNTLHALLLRGSTMYKFGWNSPLPASGYLTCA